MAGNALFVVFLLPAVISIFLGTMVMAEILKEPNRELNMWQFGEGGGVSHDDIRISGLKSQYDISESIEVRVSVRDTAFDCGDLYITIYDLSQSPKEVVTQSGYFGQCFAQTDSFLPVDEEFSEQIESPGQYEIEVKINDTQFQNTASATETFLVS